MKRGASSFYLCQSCAYRQAKWAGKCPNCGTWGSLVETLEEKESHVRKNAAKAQVHSLSKITIQKVQRTSINIPELDRVLGGGLVPGHVVLLAGEPGIGKSTLLLQAAESIKKHVYYISGEESPIQIKLRAERLALNGENISLVDETDVDSILALLEDNINENNEVGLVIVDSIQTLATRDLLGIPGSVGQVRECAQRLTRFAKSKRIPFVLVGQITKVGSVAGPATLAHMVDTVCFFEGESEKELRVLRSFKNRFGATDEIGIFKMEEKGLFGVSDVESLLQSSVGLQGSCVASVLEGTRPLLVEVQSLVVPTKLPIPKRVTSGLDPRRVDVILAVLAKHCGIPIYERDVFVNVAGGINVREPGLDLSVALALASSVYGRKLPQGVLAVGEIGLLGEIRPVPREKERINQAKRQGFSQIITSEKYPFLPLAIKKLLSK